MPVHTQRPDKTWDVTNGVSVGRGCRLVLELQLLRWKPIEESRICTSSSLPRVTRKTHFHHNQEPFCKRRGGKKMDSIGKLHFYLLKRERLPKKFGKLPIARIVEVKRPI